MLVVTSRVEFRTHIERLVPAARVHTPPRPIPADAHVVLVDMACMVESPAREAAVLNWVRAAPQRRWVLVTSFKHPEQEVRLIAQLVQHTPPEIYALGELTKATLDGMNRPHISAGNLQQELEGWLGTRTVVEAPTVWQLLAHAPDITSVSEWASGQQDSYKDIWTRLTSQGQRPPRQLVAAFRVLWSVYLRNSGEAPGAVAKRLGIPVKGARRHLGRSFNLTASAMDQLNLPRLLDVYTTLVLRTTKTGVLTPIVLPSLAELGALLQE